MHPTYDYPELFHNTLGEYTTCLPCPIIRNCTPMAIRHACLGRDPYSRLPSHAERGRNLAQEHAVSAGLSARSEHSQTDTHNLYDTTPVLFGSKHPSE